MCLRIRNAKNPTLRPRLCVNSEPRASSTTHLAWGLSSCVDRKGDGRLGDEATVPCDRLPPWVQLHQAQCTPSPTRLLSRLGRDSKLRVGERKRGVSASDDDIAQHRRLHKDMRRVVVHGRDLPREKFRVPASRGQLRSRRLGQPR